MFTKFLNKLDQSENPRKIVFIFLFIWLVVNVLQSAITELAHDEAYYWMYSRYPDWGYYDHPPMIALLIKFGYALIKNELGVRLFTIFIGVTTIYLIYLILEEHIKKLSVFLIILLSAIIIQSHIGGFLAIPDLPVVFFATLFFLLYKKYLNNDSIWLAIFLGVTAAAMLYSKYHGLLVLIFTLVSNFKIFKRKTFWIIPVITALALLPHLFWQIENNFPTFQYHLFGRSAPYRIEHTINYLYSQLFISGPLAGLILFYHAIKQKVREDIFLKGLKFNFYGFFIFFFFSSFKGHVEPHWTAIGYVPVVVLSYLSISQSELAQKWLKALFIPTFIFCLFIRVALVYEVLPKKLKVGKEFHNWDSWAQQIKHEANGRKVVFVNSFQRPSKYAFYTGGDFSYSLNSIFYRKNQYDLWHFEDSIQGKPVLLMYSRNPDDTLVTDVERYNIEFIDEFHSYYSIIVTPSIKYVEAQPGKAISLDITLFNPKNYEVQINKSNGKDLPGLYAFFHNGRDFIPYYPFLGFIDVIIPANGSVKKTVSVPMPESIGKYSCYIAFMDESIYPGFNSKPIKIKIKK